MKSLSMMQVVFSVATIVLPVLSLYVGVKGYEQVTYKQFIANLRTCGTEVRENHHAAVLAKAIITVFIVVLHVATMVTLYQYSF